MISSSPIGTNSLEPDFSLRGHFKIENLRNYVIVKSMGTLEDGLNTFIRWKRILERLRVECYDLISRCHQKPHVLKSLSTHEVLW